MIYMMLVVSVLESLYMRYYTDLSIPVWSVFR
jgi:hypothetical protein